MPAPSGPLPLMCSESDGPLAYSVTRNGLADSVSALDDADGAQPLDPGEQRDLAAEPGAETPGHRLLPGAPPSPRPWPQSLASPR